MTAPPSPPIVDHELPVQTPGGVVLATRIARPAGSAPLPTILLRTYLGRRAHRAEAEGWARHGFACAVQDVRGRFDSSGTFDPYGHETTDGRATVDRLVEQPWCDGRVIAVGGSYGAFCALAVASHPSVAAVISSVPAVRPLHAVGGVPPLLAHLHWWLLHGHASTPRTEAAKALLDDAPRRLAAWPLDALRASLPVDLPDAFRYLVDDPETPAPIDDEALAQLDVPILHVGGWYDVFLANTLDLWHTVGRAVHPRPPRGLLIGPWTHELRTHEPARYGERDHGPASRCSLGGHQVRWLRAVLDPDRDGTQEPPPVRVFELGADRWLDGSTWPPLAARPTCWFATGGTLVDRPPTTGNVRAFVDDPRSPFPSRWTPLDERRLPDRTDRAVFETAPFDAPRRFVGAPTVRLWAESDVDRVDWFVRLLEVTADGRILVLTHGALDAGREPAGSRPIERTIPMGARCVRLERGHRLRLEITGSFHPSYPRRSDGVDRFVGALRPSRRRVLCGGETPTALDWAITEEETP